MSTARNISELSEPCTSFDDIAGRWISMIWSTISYSTIGSLDNDVFSLSKMTDRRLVFRNGREWLLTKVHTEGRCSRVETNDWDRAGLRNASCITRKGATETEHYSVERPEPLEAYLTYLLPNDADLSFAAVWEIVSYIYTVLVPSQHQNAFKRVAFDQYALPFSESQGTCCVNQKSSEP